MTTVRVRQPGGVLASASVCRRCSRVDYSSVRTIAWNRHERRRRARALAKRITR
jgi:hypothetical protein